MTHIIYIDDTGTPTQKSKSKYDSGDWHSHVAVIIKKDYIKQLKNEINDLAKKYQHLNKFEEFHFIRIFSGKDGWRKVDIKHRIEIFRDFSILYKKYSFPIIIQSFTSDDLIRNKMEYILQIKIPNFDFSKLSDLTLFFLFIEIKKFLKKEKYNTPVEIKIDSGKGKHKKRVTIPFLNSISTNSEIEFVDSKQDYLIQLTDFIAFSMNRMRWIVMNEKKKEMDIEFLKIISNSNFQVINIQKVIFDAYQIKSEDYDNILRKKYDSNENLSDSEVEEIKNKRNLL